MTHEKKAVLVTGVAGHWGARVAAQLVNRPEFRVIGLDTEQPNEPIEGLDFVHADIRNPLLVDLLKTEAVDTVCHLAFTESHQPNEAAFDFNVMGTMKVFGACTEAKVKKVVLKSSTTVYGARPMNSAFLTEDTPLSGGQKYGSTRDMIEIEAFCNGFRRQIPEMTLTILRFCSIIGPFADTPMTRFLNEPWAPGLLGFDPMFQVIHEDDVVGALVYAVVHDKPGTFNVAAEGVLPLTKLMGLAGKFPLRVFHPFAYWGASILGGAGLRAVDHVPLEPDYIRYPWVGDLEKMRTELEFVPQYTAEETLREFASHQRTSFYQPEATGLSDDQEGLREAIKHRGQAQGQPDQELETP